MFSTLANQRPEIVERLLAMTKAHEAHIEPHEDICWPSP